MQRNLASADAPENIDVTAEASEAPAMPMPYEHDIADRAYQRWVERGCPQGSPEEDWFEAERELRPQNHS